jgi:hypothetical protein
MMVKPPALHCLLQYTSVSVKNQPENVDVISEARLALQKLHILEDSLLRAI